MRDISSVSDPARMFSLLCRLCQSPISWYASGPIQKYILRQIRLIDTAQLRKGSQTEAANLSLDACILMLYGQILFTSSSYTFALNYFLRALALDPGNPMVNLSVGLGYIHYAMKRQSENRQYLITQGISFIFRYFHAQTTDVSTRQIACFEMARTFQFLGLVDIANYYYNIVITLTQQSHKDNHLSVTDIQYSAAFNVWSAHECNGNKVASDYIVRSYLRL
jgi:general transcription factor 3C polypeptide 3 (transcription factor C subunit 4)